MNVEHCTVAKGFMGAWNLPLTFSKLVPLQMFHFVPYDVMGVQKLSHSTNVRVHMRLAEQSISKYAAQAMVRDS